jgi:hypothetical protein
VDKIPNEELWPRMKQISIEQQIKERKWCSIGHTLQKPQDATERHMLDWNPQGTRTRGRPRTWSRITAREMQTVGINWKETKGLALDRTKWKSLTKALRST